MEEVVITNFDLPLIEILVWLPLSNVFAPLIFAAQYFGLAAW